MLKNTFLIFAILFFNLLNAQYNINWNEAPLNEIPLRYKLEHFKLKGPVKEYKTVGLVQNFDKNGYLISGRQSDFFEFTYGANKNPTFYTFWKNETQKTIGKIILDKNGRIIENRYFNGDRYNYDKNGNFTETISNITNETKNETYIYTYDDKNRVIKSAYFNEKILWETVYSYKKEGEFLVVTSTKKDFNYAYRNSTGSTYFKNGHRYGNIKNDNVKYDQHKNVIDEVDVNGKVSDFKPIKITYYENVITPEFLGNLTKKFEIPKAKDPNCIKGNCIDGFGTYQDENGNYKGFFKSGKKDGYGVYKWNSGNSHTGYWKNNITDGYGYYTNTKGESWEGKFYNGKLNGLGSFLNSDLKGESGFYTNGKLIEKYNYSSTNNSKGCITGDCLNAYGKFLFDDGSVYVGFFKNGMLHQGTWKGANGDYYLGQFGANNTKEGYGNHKFNQSEVYFGEFINNKRNGRGVYYNSATGVLQRGEWKDDFLVKQYLD